MALLWSFCGLLALIMCTNACSEPEGYHAWDPLRVLSSSDLFVSAKFLSKFTYKRDTDEGKVFDIKLSTEVSCVIHSTGNSSIPVHVNITETRRGDMENKENPCINYFHDIRFDEPVYVMLEPRGPTEFGFVTVNLQGPYFYESDVNEATLMKGCSNIDAEAPAGGSDLACPLQRASAATCVDLTAEPEECCPEHAAAPEGGNGTSSALLPMSGATMAGVMVLYRNLV